jgi:hypothetical protein
MIFIFILSWSKYLGACPSPMELQSSGHRAFRFNLFAMEIHGSKKDFRCNPWRRHGITDFYIAPLKGCDDRPINFLQIFGPYGTEHEITESQVGRRHGS